MVIGQVFLMHVSFSNLIIHGHWTGVFNACVAVYIYCICTLDNAFLIL